MRALQTPERTMLLLFARLGEEKPLRPETYRHIMQAISEIGTGSADPDGELSRNDLRYLGLSEKEADRVLSLLEREQALERHLSYLERRQIRVITRVSPEYPHRLRRILGSQAPMLLYCAGNIDLLATPCVSLVGSRKLREPGARFARMVGAAAAKQGYTYVSGGAEGADTAGFEASLQAGGSAILFLPDALERRMERLDSQRVLLVSEDGPCEPFTVARAYARNRLIHAMGEKTFVAQSDYGTGGTWQGVMENLRFGWSPLFLCGAEGEDPAMKALEALGCRRLEEDELRDLHSLEPAQMKLPD